YRLRWDDVKYEPGTLKAVTWKNGKRWAEDTVMTTGPAAKLALKADRPRAKADGQDLIFVTVTVTDDHGLMVPRTNNRINFQVDGPGDIIAVDNGDPTNLESFQSKSRNAFNGLCLVVIRTQAGQRGSIKLTAQSPGLTGSTLALSSY